MIATSNLGKEYGARVLFEGVSLQLNAGSRYGLVGANGSGKTTFLKVLAGDEEVQELARLANRHLPELKTHDRFGNRIFGGPAEQQSNGITAKRLKLVLGVRFLGGLQPSFELVHED